MASPSPKFSPFQTAESREQSAEGELLLKHQHNALYLVVALGMIFLTLVVAVQPLYLSVVHGLARDNAGFVNANIQVITELVDLVLVGYLGYVSDRVGRVPLLVYGFLLSGITALIAPFDLSIAAFLGVNSLVVFYVVRVLMSVGGTMVWPQVATLSGDYSNVEDRPRQLANVGFMMAFGVTLVYAVLMQFAERAGLTVTMWLAALIALAGAWLSRRMLVETAQPREQISFPFQDVWELVKHKRGIRLSFLSALTSRNDMVIVGLFLMTWFIYFADLVTETTHAQAASRAGLVIGLLGVVVLVSIPVWGWLTIRIGRVPAMAIGLFLSALGFAAMGLVFNPFSWWILVPVFLIGVGQAGCILLPQTLVLDLAPDGIRGSVLGVFNTVGCFGVIFFLQVGGILFDWIGPTAPFIFTGVVNLLLFGYALAVMKLDADEGVSSRGEGLSSV
ncbi:magnetosome biogenesis transporter MamH [Candidatus Magnetaquicoccus inordinatus]|uniref:magnetosome biogenesis transporter MamH n=1 Tax=Candidatus Magnetaquicoccus inordinatus TaxID=2496818 RepID=UPI00102B0A96|nr:magnetosome biogenesis transporter MamH [Candidatus Magnetaquicoccus inordinatus]